MGMVRTAVAAARISTVVLFAALESRALALPRLGEGLPPVSAPDLTGQIHSTRELVGHRTLVVAITDKNAGPAVRAWYAAADRRVPATVARQSLVSIHLPFFISTAYAEGKAREQTPPQYWHATLLDRGDLAARLGLDSGEVPDVFVLDENGRVVAAVHAPVDSPRASEIWNAFTTR
jgi:hypothetical protein